MKVAVGVYQDFHVRAYGLAHRGNRVGGKSGARGGNLALQVATVMLAHLWHEGISLESGETLAGQLFGP